MNYRVMTRLVLLVMLVSCSGGGVQAPALGPGVLPQAAIAPAASKDTGTVDVTIVIPEKTERRSRFVSPSTKSIAIRAYSPKQELLAKKTVDLHAGAKGCKKGSYELVCTIRFEIVAGKDRFSATTYDRPKGKGQQLSSISNVARTVDAGKVVKLPLVLQGIVHSVSMQLIDASAFETGDSVSGFQFAGLFAHVMQLEALDADGNIILGPPAPPTLSLGSSDAADLTVKPVKHNAGEFELIPHAAVSRIRVTATATAKHGSPVHSAASLSIGSVLYVANAAGTGPTAAGSVTAYVPWSDTPVETIVSGMDAPQIAVVDRLGNLWVGNRADGSPGTASIVKFAPGDTSPSRTISGITALENHGYDSLTVDRMGNVYCVCNQASGVDEFTPSGGSIPSRTLTEGSSASGIDTPTSVVTDASGNLYVANYASDAIGISVFAPGGTTPSRNITQGISGVTLLFIDKHGNLYAGNYLSSPNTITEYAPGGSTPIKTFGSIFGIAMIFALTVDASGDVYAGNYGASVTEFAPLAPATPSRTLTLGASYRFGLWTDPLRNLYVPVQESNTVSIYPRASTTASRSLSSSDGIDEPSWVVTWP